MASRTTAACRRLLLLAVLLVLALPASAQDVQLVFVDSPSLLNRVYLYPSSFTPPIPHDPTVYTIRSPPPANPYACPSLSPIPSLPPSTLLLVLRGGPPSSSPCTFVDKAHVAQAAGAALMVVIDAQNSTGGGMGGDAFAGQTVLSAMATWEDGQALEALDGQTVSVRLYVRPVWDVSFLLMFLMALATLVGAAWLSAAKERKLEGRGRRSGGGGAGEYGVADEDVETVAYLDVAAAAGFVVVASGALLLLYFFIDVLIYGLLGLFAVGGGSSLATIIALALSHAFPSRNRRLHAPPLPAVRLFTVLSVAPAAAVALVWLVLRHESWSWVLQDLMGVCLLLQLQRVLRLGSIKVATILLSLAFLYDTFWVFASARIFSSSVMVTVATGGGTGESVPMLLRLPRLQDELYGSTMLGLGDIALPGLLVSFLLRFDYHRGYGWARGYFLWAALGYAVGVWLTYAALTVMKSGQPALLYIVPTTLYTIIALAWLRGDLRAMWEGSDEEKAEERMHNARMQGRPRQSSSNTPPARAREPPSSEALTSALLRRDSAADRDSEADSVP